MKKLIALLILLTMSTPVFAADISCNEQVLSQQHMFAHKNAPCDKVIVTNLRNIVCKGNVFNVGFDCKLWSEKAAAGQKISFSFPEAVYTQEGTLIIPACTKISATIIKIQKQRMFNKNARVYLTFDCITFPDGSTFSVSARPFTKDGALKEGPWMTAGKIAGATVGMGIVGAGAGTGFAFIPNPAKLGAGFAIGIPVGCSVGLITGLLTPGLKYHAKAGEGIKIVLCDDLSLKKSCH